MKNNINKITTILLLLVASVFISCSSDEEDNPLSPTGNGGNNTGTTYTLTYNGNGATGTPTAISGLTAGQTVTLDNGTGMTKSGYDFDGWTNSTGAEYAGGSAFTIATSDVTLYAKWIVDPFPSVLYRDMVIVPGGGTPVFTNAWDSDILQYSKTTSFKMAKYEVTYELWHTVRVWATNNGYTFAHAGKEGSHGTIGLSSTSKKYEPVTTVNWRDAMVWCNAYSAMTGLTPCYTYSTAVIKNSSDANGTACDGVICDWNATGYRLPTEGEWQYAASYKNGTAWTPYDFPSGGTGGYTGTASTDYSNFSPYAWFGNSATSPTGNATSTKNVGTKTENQLAIHDMTGNVWEWCWDWYAYWPASLQTDFKGPSSGSYRVLRGGGWYSTASGLQVGYRDYGHPVIEGNDLGLRLVRR